MSTPVQYHYGKFPPQEIDWQRLISLIGSANAALARYDGTLCSYSQRFCFVDSANYSGSCLSSRIEGTEATMGEVLEQVDDLQTARQRLPGRCMLQDFPTEILPASLRLLINFLKNAFCYPRRGSQRQGIKGSRPVGGQSPANILSSLLRLMARYSLSFEKISRVMVSSYPICFSAFTTSANSMVPAPRGR